MMGDLQPSNRVVGPIAYAARAKLSLACINCSGSLTTFLRRRLASPTSTFKIEAKHPLVKRHSPECLKKGRNNAPHTSRSQPTASELGGPLQTGVEVATDVTDGL